MRTRLCTRLCTPRFQDVYGTGWLTLISVDTAVRLVLCAQVAAFLETRGHLFARQEPLLQVRAEPDQRDERVGRLDRGCVISSIALSPLPGAPLRPAGAAAAGGRSLAPALKEMRRPLSALPACM